MTTSDSPEPALRKQANGIANILKRTSRGETVTEDRGGRIKASLAAGVTTVGIVMDDKVIKLTVTWDKVRETEEPALAEYILGLMREKRGAVTPEPH